MGYRIMPTSEAWAGGVFCLPKSVIKKIKLIDSTKLSVLTVALGSDEIDEKAISLALKTDIDEVCEALDFWVSEGILTDGEQITVQADAEESVEVKQAFEKLPMPSLSPKDIVAMCRENSDLAELLRDGQRILGTTIPLSMQSNLINMVTYYGLTVPVVLTLLQYYKNERDKGKSFTTHRLQQMAREWAEEEITTLDKAMQKLQDIVDIQDIWSRTVELCEMEYRKPTSAQQKMLLRWKADFSMEMITFAINTMKKYNEKDKQSIKEVDNILKDWKRKGCTTPDDVKSYKKPEKKKTDKKSAIASTYNLDEIMQDIVLNDNYDI